MLLFSVYACVRCSILFSVFECVFSLCVFLLLFFVLFILRTRRAGREGRRDGGRRQVMAEGNEASWKQRKQEIISYRTDERGKKGKKEIYTYFC